MGAERAWSGRGNGGGSAVQFGILEILTSCGDVEGERGEGKDEKEEQKGKRKRREGIWGKGNWIRGPHARKGGIKREKRKTNAKKELKRKK